MINFLSSWVKNLALALIVVSILEMILPNNKIKKYVKMIMGLYILFSIISPFIENSDKLDIKNTDIFEQYIEKSSSSDIKVDQSSMNNKLNKMYQEELEKDIIKKLKDRGYEVEDCKVLTNAFDDEKNSDNDNAIEKIKIKIARKIDKETIEGKSSDTIESKIITEIQKIQKVEINISENEEDNGMNNEQRTSNITKTDIKIIRDFLISEYGVNKKCLKIS